MKSKKKNRKRKISFFKVLAFILFIVSAFVGFIFYKLDILPIKYFSLLVGVLIFVNILCDLFLMRARAKKRNRIIFSAISIIFIGVMGFASYYILDTLGFLNNIKNVNYKTENYSVIVLKDSKYKKISDIKDLDVGYYSNSVGSKKANKELLKKVDVNFENYADANQLVDSMLSNNEKVILIEDSVLAMIKEDKSDFDDKTRVIYSFSIKIKSSTTAKEVNVTSEAFNIYISGIDTYGKISSVSRSDVNMIMTINPKTKQILLTSIPRDYYVQLHGTTGTRDKLTHAGMYGVDMSISTIEDLLDIKINYYIKVNFTSLIDIVNSLGGITVYSDYTFTSIDGKHYTKGNNAMNGEQALSFARERKAFGAGDRQRVKDQQAVITAIIKKVCSKTILLKYDSLLDSLNGEFQTNMGSKKITSLIKMQLNDMASWTVSTYSLEGADSSNYTYSGGNVKLYVMEPVLGSVEQATQLINSVIKGKKLKDTYTYDGPINTVTNSDTTKKTTSSNNSDNTNSKSKKTASYVYAKCNDPEDGICLIDSDEFESGEIQYDCEDSIHYKLDSENNKCIIKDSTMVDYPQEVDAIVGCEDGFTLSDNKCIRKKQIQVSACDTGYSYQKSGKICCPNGYSYDPSTRTCIED